ncbi:MAG: hypothetical protein IJ094_02320 [Bacilli bacterium]|nr:hypothetical protein [Bacilli bacterium]
MSYIEFNEKEIEEINNKEIDLKMSLLGKDTKELEYNVYKTNNDIKKIDIELRRIIEYLKVNPEMMEKVLYYYYQIKNEYDDKKFLNDAEELYNIKKDILKLELLCNMKVGMYDALHENSNPYVDSEKYEYKGTINCKGR